MIPELGHFSLILTLCLATVLCIFPMLGATNNAHNWMAVARPAAAGQFVFMLLAYACLTYAFIYNDFSVQYVANHSNTQLPLMYRIASVWGGHEGSLLLWALILSLWTVAVALFSRSLPQAMVARVLSVMGFVSIGFLLFMISTSNPFERAFPVPLEGRDLNPLLQDPGLIIHPPMLYMGYVGFSVVFGFAIAALMSGQLDSAWARWSRPWTLVAWLFLTLGITLGSWWAYYELGWGGWWFWDPVENASFMPWLVGTALIHSLAVTEKRSAFKTWTILLAILSFSLSLLGTFLVRSGVLTSVHAFASDPERGVFILGFLTVVVGLSLALYAWRAPRIAAGGNFALFSKESFLLFNNILLVVACATVLFGTLYPLFLDAFNLDKISVGPPYFDLTFMLLMLPMAVLLGLGPLARWKQDQPVRLFNVLWLALVASIILGSIIVFLAYGLTGLIAAPALMIALWIIFTSILSLRERLANKTNPVAALGSLPLHFHGMLIAHIGVAIFIIGVALVKTFDVEQDVRMELNQPIEINGLHYTLTDIQLVKGPNYTAQRGTIEIRRADTLLTTLHPEKRAYLTQQMPMTEAAISVGLTRDLYVALGEALTEDAWAVRVYNKPFIRWIWVGALLMALGGLLAASDKRYRRIAQRETRLIGDTVTT